jgi:glycosyltransferase involved in cell wall biosynthesis
MQNNNQNNCITVSIVIPCRNEVNYIERCIKSVIENDFPEEELEIIVVDGMSKDATREYIRKYTAEFPFVKLLKNHEKHTPIALNLGIAEARGRYIIILSSHSTVARDFIQKNIDNMTKHDVDCVGGVLLTQPGDESDMAHSISLALTSVFGVGNSYFRTGTCRTIAVDTVAFGCYRKEVFYKYCFFNENLLRNQDIEFNKRIIRLGGKILLCPDIVSFYYARTTLTDLIKQYYLNGFWVSYSSKFASLAFSFRHTVPGFFVGILSMEFIVSLIFPPAKYLFFTSILLYLIFDISYSTRIALNKNMRLLVSLILIFPSLHLSYGVGLLMGIVKKLSTSIPDKSFSEK